MPSPVRVLLVEDDPQTQKIVEKVLTRDSSLRYLDLQVTIASDGAEGLERFREQTFDLIITGLLMPKLDGFKLLEAIRASPQGKTVPLIVLSAVFRDRQILQRLEREHGAVLQNKPFSPKQLARQVHGLLGSRRPAAPPAPAAPAPTRAAGPATVQAGASEPGPVAAPQTADPAPAPPLRRGTLAESPVPSLLLEAQRNQFSGTLDVRRGKARKLIHFLEGRPIFVQSNLRAETLGQMLVRRGGLRPEQNTEALALAEREGIKYGEALVRLGLMSESQVMAELVTQTRAKIESCLAWRSGSYDLTVDAAIAQKVPRCPVDPVRLVFEGLQRHPDLEEAFTRLAEKGAFGLALRPEFAAHRSTFVELSGARVVEAVAPGRSVAEVIQAAGPPHEAVLQIDALLQCGLAELMPPPRGKRPSSLSRPVVEASISLEHLAGLAPEPPAPSAAPAPETREEDSPVIWISPEATPRPVRPAARLDPERARVALQLVQSTYLGLHEANHYQILGVTSQSDSGQIEVAYKVKRRQFDPSAFRDIELGEQRGRLDEIVAALDEAYAVLADPRRRVEYDRALIARSGQRARSNALRAEELCGDGEDLVEKRHFSEAEVAFAKACQLDDQPQYHALHALARFLASGETPQAAEEAMVEVKTAMAGDPGDITAHLVAAKIRRSLAEPDLALGHLQKLIKIDPSCQEAFDELEDLLLEQGDFARLEVEYRRTLHLCGTQDPAWSALLWHRLALLYRDQLDSPERARLAAAAALRLKPRDRDLQALLAEIDRASPERWPEAVLGYRSLLRSDPDQEEPLHQLFRLHRDAGRLDAAYLCACTCQLREKSSDEERAFLAERRRGPRPQQPLSPLEWEKLRHADDDPRLAGLLELLGPRIEELHPLRLEDFGVEAGELIARQTLPRPLAEALEQSAILLALPCPGVALNPRLGSDVQALGTNPPVLLCGDAALGCEDPLELAFRVTRALALLRPGRRVVVSRPRRLLRAYILAAVSAALPQVRVPDRDGAVARATEALRQLPDLQEAVRATVLGLRERFQQLNLADWQRGIQRTAERAALLGCGDLFVAGRVLFGLDPEAVVELCDFALSEALVELRSGLGLAVS